MDMNIEFQESEMKPMMVQPGFPGAPDRAVLSSPITPKENLLAAIHEKRCMFVPNARDCININTGLILDNKARATMTPGPGEEQFVPGPDGQPDAFGVTWIYDPKVMGSMVRPGNPLLEDVEDWEDVIQFPDPDSWDWKAESEKYKDYLSDSRFAYMSTIFTGFFERLISFMDFEEAAIAMIDEDSRPYVVSLFQRLADLYISYVEHIKEAFDVDIIELHDDWGSQMAPFMREETYRETVFPTLKRVIDRVHELGMGFQLHSCGKIESLVPMMCDLGVDIWMGQNINDKAPLVEQYGDKIIVQVEAPELGPDATEDEVKSAAQEFVNDYVLPGRVVQLSIYSASEANPPSMTDYIYRYSRQKWLG